MAKHTKKFELATAEYEKEIKDLRRRVSELKRHEAEHMVDNRDLRTKYEREESCHNLTKARLDKHRKMMHDARRALTP